MAAKKGALRVTTDADAKAATAAAAAKKAPKSLADAAETGSYLDILVAQRREMIRDVKGATGPAVAALHRQIALHSKEIEALKVAAKQEADESAAPASDEEYGAEAI